MMVPQQVKAGYIRGIYPAVLIQTGDRFKATLGCLANKPECNVIFRLQVWPEGALSPKTLAEWNETGDKQLREVDLKLDTFSLAGTSASLVLTVHAAGPPADAVAIWVQPRIVR